MSQLTERWTPSCVQEDQNRRGSPSDVYLNEKPRSWILNLTMSGYGQTPILHGKKHLITVDGIFMGRFLARLDCQREPWWACMNKSWMLLHLVVSRFALPSDHLGFQKLQVDGLVWVGTNGWVVYSSPLSFPLAILSQSWKVGYGWIPIRKPISLDLRLLPQDFKKGLTDAEPMTPETAVPPTPTSHAGSTWPAESWEAKESRGWRCENPTFSTNWPIGPTGLSQKLPPRYGYFIEEKTWYALINHHFFGVVDFQTTPIWMSNSYSLSIFEETNSSACCLWSRVLSQWGMP